MKPVSLMVLVGLLWVPQSIWGQSFVDRVLVAVDNVPLTLSEYRVRHQQEVINGIPLDPFNGEVDIALLERMIDERLQIIQAQQQGLTVSTEEVDAAMVLIAQQNNLTVNSMVSRLEGEGITETEFRASVREQQLIRKLVTTVANARVFVSDQEIDNFLSAHDELQSREVSFEVSHLRLETKGKTESEINELWETMRQIRQRVQEGLPFDQAARNHSDSATKDVGGYLGWRKSDQFPELFVQALNNMEPDNNFLSEILEGGSGLHLLMLHERKEEGERVEQQLVHHILIAPNEQNNLEESRVLANTIYNELVAGESFAKMARLYSMDAQSRDEGGSLGWVNPGSLVPAFEGVAKGLDIGEISPPVRTQFGFHLIRVMDRRTVNLGSEIAASRARQEIFRRKAEEMYDRWLQSIRQRAFIEYVGLPEVPSS